MLNIDVAADFLLERTAGRRRSADDDAERARALAAELGQLALALEHAGAYIARHRSTFGQYQDLLRVSRDKVFAWSDPTVTHYPRAIAATWQTSVAQLSAPRGTCWSCPPGSRPNRCRSSCSTLPFPAPISATCGGARRPRRLYAGGARRRRAAIHGASAGAGRDPPRHGGRRIARAPRRGAELDQHRVRGRSAGRPYLGAARSAGPACAGGDAARCQRRDRRAHGQTDEPACDAVLRQGAACRGGADVRRALAIDEKAFGPDHPNVAIGLSNLAVLLQATNRLAEAEPMFRRALAIDEKAFGPDHPEVATDLNNLAELLRATNRLAEAEPMYRRALAIDEKAFGPDHPEVATDLNNLALLLRATNRLAEAEPMFRRALAIDEQAFGPDHPNVASGLNNLALLLRATNRLAEAEPMYRRALAIDEQAFGPDHPNVASGLNNLAQLLRATNRLAEAEPMFRRAMAIDEKAFGPDHPNFASDPQQPRRIAASHQPARRGGADYRRALAI